MPNNIEGVDEITIEDIEAFLSSGWDVPPASEEGEVQGQEGEEDITQTQTFAKRLKAATTKARQEERDEMAKELGYENYAELQAAREKDILSEHDLDVEKVTPVVEQLLQKRLKEDPLMLELEELRMKKVEEWGKKELDELIELTGGKISKIEDVPKDVIELWKTKGSLKSAYLELKGEELIKDIKTGVVSGQSKGSTAHLKNPSPTPTPMNKRKLRPFTQQEKSVYKMFNPDVTEEELNKMTKEA